MSDLAAQTSLTSSGITRLVDRLVAAGSVQRQACATDRRTTYAVITDKGRARLEAALPGHLELIERWLVGPIPSGELAAFVATLRTLRDGVRPCAEAGGKPLVVPGAQPSADVRETDVSGPSGPDVSRPRGPDVSRPTVASAGPHAS